MQVLNEFISIAEQQALITWMNTAKLNVRNQPDHLLNRPQNKDKLPTTGERKSKFIRLNDGPPEFYSIQERIKEEFSLSGRDPLGRQGKVIVHEVDSETPEHVDHFNHMGPGYLHTTIMVQNADEGGQLIYAGQLIDIPDRGCLTFDSEQPHEVTLVEAGKRIVFVYGWKDYGYQCIS